MRWRDVRFAHGRVHKRRWLSLRFHLGTSRATAETMFGDGGGSRLSHRLSGAFGLT